jgi:hypothetical protein
MGIFQKRETLVQNIAFLAIMAAINVVLLLLATLLPYLLLFLTLILPFVSLLVTIYCKKRYYPMYLLATIGLSFLVSFDAISNILFYILPGILSGFVFGYCLEREIPSNYSILYSALVYVMCSYLSLVLCNALLGESVEEVYFRLLNLDLFPLKSYLIAPFIFAIAIIQSSLSYLVIQREIGKLGLEEKEISDDFELLYLLAFILLTLLSYWIKPEIYLMFLGFTIYEFLNILKDTFRKSTKLFVISLGVALGVIIFGLAIFYTIVSSEALLLILLVPIFIVGIIVFVNNCLIKPKEQI